MESQKAAAAKRAPIEDHVKVKAKPVGVPGHKGAQTHRSRRSRDMTLHDAALHSAQITRGTPPKMELPKRG